MKLLHSSIVVLLTLTWFMIVFFISMFLVISLIINSLLSLITLKLLAKVAPSSFSLDFSLDLAKIIACDWAIAFSPFLLVLGDVSIFKGLIISWLFCDTFKRQFKRSFMSEIKFFNAITDKSLIFFLFFRFSPYLYLEIVLG